MHEARKPTESRTKVWATSSIASSGALALLYFVPDPLSARALALSLVYLVLALSELVPPFVPTVFLLTATPIALGPLSDRYQLSSVLSWAADPVIALFAAGFALGLAAKCHRIDTALASRLVRWGGRSQRRLVGLLLLAAAGTSMWMSNVAAAALLLAALGPLLAARLDEHFRKALLLAVAMGANVGGMATPLGSGPNAIAMAAAQSIDFLAWMSFGIPIVLGMLLLAFVTLLIRFELSNSYEVDLPEPPPIRRAGKLLLGVFAVGIAAWLTEAWHGASAPIVGLALMLLLFGTGLLRQKDLGEIDWATLGLIAGGLVLGRLLESTGLLSTAASSLALNGAPRWLWLGSFVLASALLSSLMSNTATAALLIPLSLQLDPSPSTAVIIAIATSFGMPFPISTPPNAMVYGTGHVNVKDLLQIGLPLMLVGCAVVILSGAWFLGLLGIDG